MARRSAAARLNCEPLEARDVPAIVLNATANADVTDFAPNGGFVGINELAFDEFTQVVFRDGTPVDPTTRSPIANDTITLTQSGPNLVITSTDGIFGRATNLNNALVFYGNTLTVPNVTGLNVALQLGGDDNVTENTLFASNIDGGPGSDVIQVAGGAFNPLAAFFLQTPEGIQQLQMIAPNISPAKTLFGGDGNDFLIATGALTTLNMIGGAGNDSLVVPTFATFSNLIGGAGDDTIHGPQFGFIVTLSGGDGQDTLRGPLFGRGNFLDGGAGNDTVIGGLGLETIVGGTGSDILAGQGGLDAYLALDVDRDFVFNLPGDFVSADPFDVLAFDTRPSPRRR